jgi:hypothetical protein
MRLVLAGVRKLRTRTASFVSLLIVIAIVAVPLMLIGASLNSMSSGSADSTGFESSFKFPNAYDLVLALVFAYGGLVAMIYVATIGGSEWTSGTLKAAIARGESRSRYAVATFASASIVLGIGLVATFLVGVVAAVIGVTLGGVSLAGIADGPAVAQVLIRVVRCWIAIVAMASVAYAIAMVAKSQMAGIGTVIGVFIASSIVPFLLPEQIRKLLDYLPFSIANVAIGLPGFTGTSGSSDPSAIGSTTIDPNFAMIVTLAWLIGSVAVAAISTERAEITG